MVIGEGYTLASHSLHFIMMVPLCFIMIRVANEFEIDKSNLRQYRFDALVGSAQATIPWFVAALYIHYILLPQVGESWPASKTLLAGRFAAPTSAGVLFTMLAAAKLTKSWTYGKARVLAIFDDIETVALMVPLLVIKNGFSWHSAMELLVMGGLLWIGWRFQHTLRLPRTWKWTAVYSVVLSLVCAACGMEVLLPAFVLGWIMRFQNAEEFLEHPAESCASKVISCVFLALVGLSMPPMLASSGAGMPLATLFMHAVNLMVLICVGKMFPFFAYRRQHANWRDRLSLSVAMFARGEMGLAVLVVSQAHGIGGEVVQIAMMCLAMNQLMTGLFITCVLWLSKPETVSSARLRALRPSRRQTVLTASSLVVVMIGLAILVWLDKTTESIEHADREYVTAAVVEASRRQRRDTEREHKRVVTRDSGGSIASICRLQSLATPKPKESRARSLSQQASCNRPV